MKEGESMAQDAIAQITQAEEQAEILCRVSTERAVEMRAEAKKQGEAHLAEVQRSATEEYTRKLTEMRENAEALLKKKRAEAEEQAKAMAATAEERMAEAVKMIVWGIVEKCQ